MEISRDCTITCYVSEINMGIDKKFIFTQVLAQIVCGCSVLLLALVIRKYHPIDAEDFRNFSIAEWLLLLALFVTMPLSMYIWGRILVLMGFLSKEEGRCYPYSKL
jgi:hypothetical protein